MGDIEISLQRKKLSRDIQILLLFAVAGLVAPQALGETFSPQHEKVKQRFQSKEEKTAKDAAWTARNTFKVGVINDGTRRDGYAEYICQVLYDYGFKGNKVWVHVIDIVKLVQYGHWV